MTTSNTTNLAFDARMAAQLSQREFATLIGVHYSTIAHWETGKKIPSSLAKSLLKLVSSDAERAQRVLRASAFSEVASG